LAKIAILEEFDLYLTYSWSSVNHGICGHTYEVIEYYHILKDHFNVGILLCEDITPVTFMLAIQDKYNFTYDEIDDILKNTRFINRPSLLRGKNILFTDGGVRSTSKLTLLFDNIIHFACGDKEVKNNSKDNTYILQDNRVYDPVYRNGINYKKKILFNRLKHLKEAPTKNLIYATKNCRDIPDELYSELEGIYQEDFICLTTDGEVDGVSDRFKFLDMPVPALFEMFDTYIYTPIPRHFDCSPRFIAECHFYDKIVHYHNIDYLEEDSGLKWRKHDIENDFESLYLTPKDGIIEILKRIME